MLLGALLDAGASLDAVRSAVGAVVPGEVAVRASTVTRAGLRALKVDVESLGEDHPHRSWARIRTLLESADLPTAIREPALAVFARLADAEGRVHGIPPDDVALPRGGVVGRDRGHRRRVRGARRPAASAASRRARWRWGPGGSARRTASCRCRRPRSSSSPGAGRSSRAARASSPHRPAWLSCAPWPTSCGALPPLDGGGGRDRGGRARHRGAGQRRPRGGRRPAVDGTDDVGRCGCWRRTSTTWTPGCGRRCCRRCWRPAPPMRGSSRS